MLRTGSVSLTLLDQGFSLVTENFVDCGQSFFCRLAITPSQQKPVEGIHDMIGLFLPTQNGFGQGFLRMVMSLPDAPDEHLGEIIQTLGELVLYERGGQRVTLLRFQFEHPRRIQTSRLQREMTGFDWWNPREEIRRNQVQRSQPA